MKYSLLFFLCLFLLILLTRLILFYSYRQLPIDGEKLAMVTRITSEPKILPKVQRFQIRLQDGTRVQITTGKFPLYRYGDLIDIQGELKVAELDNGTKLFNLSYPQIRLSEEDNNPLLAISNFIRQKATQVFERTLSPTQSGLLLGIVLGIKKDMPEDFYNELQTAGVLHVIAASGMNVTMVGGALYFLLARLHDRRKALVGTVLGIGFYALLAGLEPSIIRAAIMASTAFAAGLLGRQKLPLYILFLTAGCMLLISPYLLQDIGFQLSVLATMGIMTVKPLLHFFERGRLGKLIGEDISTTIAAQATTLPILLTNFGSVNLLSIAVNAIVLWTIPPLMFLGGLATILSLLLEPLALPFLYLSIPLLTYFENIISWSSRVTINFQLEHVPATLSLGYFLILFSLIIFLKQPNRIALGKNMQRNK